MSNVTEILPSPILTDLHYGVYLVLELGRNDLIIPGKPKPKQCVQPLRMHDNVSTFLGVCHFYLYQLYLTAIIYKY